MIEKNAAKAALESVIDILNNSVLPCTPAQVRMPIEVLTEYFKQEVPEPDTQPDAQPEQEPEAPESDKRGEDSPVVAEKHPSSYVPPTAPTQATPPEMVSEATRARLKAENKALGTG